MSCVYLLMSVSEISEESCEDKLGYYMLRREFYADRPKSGKVLAGDNKKVVVLVGLASG